ncbi:hypothetical protein OG948_57525 (plasmid) [Embleya sp. NBC_00888]|uniref:hypothetical protein n=1 Tax=Embleya sp. NBC_00888 TaxID=2975960 RepID=UPI0038662EF4|nr:hypothetical protein OG948_57525 [Embleya sp. NBC_00888]
MSGKQAYPGYGPCGAVVCPSPADSPLGPCSWHGSRYRRDGRPGKAAMPSNWWPRYEKFGKPVPIDYGDQAAFRRWCAAVPAHHWPGQINLGGLRPLVRAEIQWGLFVHTRRARPSRWDLGWIRSLVTTCRTLEVNSLVDFEFGTGGSAAFTGAIAEEILHELRLVYFTPQEAKDAGFLETEHFGVLFPHRMSHIDLSGIPQRRLRDLTWDHVADLLRSPRCPRSAGPVDDLRRASVEPGTFLEVEARGGGHDPAVPREEHAQRFVADQRHREREGLPSPAIKRPDGTASVVTTVTRSVVFNAVRKLMREALDTGAAERLGLKREFIIAFPTAGATTGRTARRPFPDEVALALADEANPAELAATYDAHDNGVRDIWETTVTTGRRIGEVIKVRWDCIGRYGGLAMFWHDQTKVGNHDAAIRIPERLYELLAERRRKTLDRFTARYGYRPTGAQRSRAGSVSHDPPQPGRDRVTDPSVVLQPVPALGGHHGPRPLRPPPGSPHSGGRLMRLGDLPPRCGLHATGAHTLHIVQALRAVHTGEDETSGNGECAVEPMTTVVRGKVVALPRTLDEIREALPVDRRAEFDAVIGSTPIAQLTQVAAVWALPVEAREDADAAIARVEAGDFDGMFNRDGTPVR